MKFIYQLMILLFGMQSAYAMEAPPSRKRGPEESEEQGAAKVAYVEPTVEERFAFEALPNEIKKQILEYLVTATGGTADIRLSKAADNIRNFMALGLKNKAFEPFLNDENLHGYLITQLANRYAGGNRGKAALYLRTNAGGRWLAAQEPKIGIIQALGPLFSDATQNNDINAVSYLLQIAGVDLLLHTWTDGLTPLMVAAHRGYTVLVERMLESLASLEPQALAEYVNRKGINGVAALSLAAETGHLQIVEKLLAVTGIDVNSSNDSDMTPFLYAVSHGRTRVVEKLLTVPQVDVTWKDDENNTALMYASSLGHTAIVSMLLANDNTEINAQNVRGFTALIYAAQNGYIKIVELLLAVPGININARNYVGDTALMNASEKGHTAIVEKLLAMPGIDVNARDNNLVTALIAAAEKGHEAVVRKLLSVPGIDINAQTLDGNTALMYAAYKGHTAIVEQLLAMPSIQVNIADNSGQTALVSASERGHIAIVKKLLAMPGIDVNRQADNGETALEFAQDSESPNKDAIIKLLKAHGAVE